MGNTKCFFCGSDVQNLNSLAYSGISRKFQCPVCGIYELRICDENRIACFTVGRTTLG